MLTVRAIAVVLEVLVEVGVVLAVMVVLEVQALLALSAQAVMVQVLWMFSKMVVFLLLFFQAVVLQAIQLRPAMAVAVAAAAQDASSLRAVAVAAAAAAVPAVVVGLEAQMVVFLSACLLRR